MDDSVIDFQSNPEVQMLLASASETISADSDVLASALLAWVRRRARRQTRARALVASGITAAVAAGTALTIATSAAPSALAAVTSAVAKTTAQTYHASTTMTEAQLIGAGATAPGRLLVTGEFDPAHHAYAEHITQFLRPVNGGRNQPAPFPEVRVVGGYGYLYASGLHKWIRESPRSIQEDPRVGYYVPIPAAGPRHVPSGQHVNLAQADPQKLLAILHSAAIVSFDGKVSGAGWTGNRYAFTATGAAPGYPAGPAALHGTVDVDQHGFVRDIALHFRTPGVVRTTPGTAGKMHYYVPSFHITVHATFGDFGAAVSISPPPASQVIQLR